MSESDHIDDLERKGSRIIELAKKLVRKLKNKETRTPIIVGFICAILGWLISDGRGFEYIEPKLQSSCFNTKTYPLGRWNYTIEVPAGNLTYYLHNYLVFETDSSGHIPSDHSLQGRFEFIGEFKPNNALRQAYRDERGYCSINYYTLSMDGCSMSGQGQGYHPGDDRPWEKEETGKYKGCPKGFPDVGSLSPTQRTKMESSWTGRRPYIWELWNTK